MPCSICQSAVAGIAVLAGSAIWATSDQPDSEPRGVNPEALIEMLKASAEGEPEPVDPMMDMNPAMMVEMLKAAGKPDAAHKMLHTMVGEWDMKAEFMMSPGAPPEVSTGVSTSTLGLNGLCVISDVEMDFTFMGQMIPMKGIGVMGYNRATGKYESMWMDTTDPYMLVQRGTMKDGKLVVTGKSTGSMGETMMRNVYVFEDEDTWKMEFYQPNPMDPKGDWPKVGTIHYKRK